MAEHRSPRRRKRTPASANLTTAFRSPSVHGMNENPNGGKRSASPVTGREHGLTMAEHDAHREGLKGYVPLTVHTPIKRARIEPRTTHYTI